MSSKLAQYLQKERHETVTLNLNIGEIRESVDEVIGLLYPQRQIACPEGLEARVTKLKTRFLHYFESVSALSSKNQAAPADCLEAFFSSLPEVARVLDTDVDAAYAGDPAAYSREEIILTYPGFYAVCVYRLAHVLYELKLPLLPRLMCEYAHEKTGIDINPGAKIDESFFIDHGTGVVIGETSIIGKNVKIYQGVTLGALSVKKKLQSKKRHPTIEDDVVIYANSTILGGETTIGAGSVIGGNTWLTESIPAGSVALNQQKISLGNK